MGVTNQMYKSNCAFLREEEGLTITRFFFLSFRCYHDLAVGNRGGKI